MWFVTEVLPLVHVSSRVKNNWHPFALVGGSAPLYSTFVTSSDKAFGLFLINYYRNPPLAKEPKTKTKKHDGDDEGKNDDNDNKKRIYKKKIDIRQGEKDYKKWMTTIQTLKKENGKQGVDNVDKRLTSIISNHRRQLMQQGVDIREKVQEVVNVPDNDDYVDFEAVGICGV